MFPRNRGHRTRKLQEKVLKLVHKIEDARNVIADARRENKKIGFVPTMGALHEGHLTLVRRAREMCDYVCVSIFVNPTQFGPNEDLNKYPRTLESDAERCREAGVDLIFAPSAAEMYPEGFNSWVKVKGLTEMLEGEIRPGHFRGVTTVCAKLFNIIEPDYAFFGTKDYQQLKVIEKMICDLNMRLKIVPVETVRESDGLAMSSRNAYLSTDERQSALILSKSLQKAREAFNSGERSAAAIQELVENLIKTEQSADIDYVAVVDGESLAPIDEIIKPAVVLLAVRIGKTRLIDNMLLHT